MSTPILSTALTPAYTCRHCRKTLTLSGPPIIGQARLPQVGQLLVDHLAAEHQQLLAALGMEGQKVAGWLFAEQFKHNDDELSAASNQVRLQFRRGTQRVIVRDENLQAQIETHIPFAPAETKATVLALLKGLRDTLEEVTAPPVA